MVNGTLVSGGLSNRIDQAYGRFEFRVRTDPDPTLTTSGVVLTWPQSQNWPIDGENNIYETTLEADRIPIKSFVHYGATNQQYWDRVPISHRPGEDAVAVDPDRIGLPFHRHRVPLRAIHAGVVERTSPTICRSSSMRSRSP
jgi:hypothetical protein